METTKTRYQCRHIFTAGRRCQSPSLRGQDFCYFHQTNRPSSAPPQHTHPEAFTLPMPEDRAAIQLALGQVIARIAAGTLNARRAGLLLYALQIASLNLPKATESDPETQVEEIIEDPIHGPLAPKAEYKTPNEEEPLDRTGRGRTFVEILLEDWKAGHLTNVAPDIKAVAEPRHSERRNAQFHRAGRSRRIPKNPTPPRNPEPSNRKFAQHGKVFVTLLSQKLATVEKAISPQAICSRKRPRPSPGVSSYSPSTRSSTP